ncbi:MAG: hypothetical protein K2L94_01320 [Alphaproteobacteria bacterium]|nr:hypothetical protein [Alphaproteobacteria bacterium]
MPLIDTLFDLLSAASGALVGAVVTSLFNRGRRRQMSDQIVLGRHQLEKVQLENDRLLEVIRDKENLIQQNQKTILQMQMQILGTRGTRSVKKTSRTKKK